MKIRKIIKILSILMLCTTLSSCFPKDDGINEKVNIVCTIFPEYDWVKQIVGNSHSVTYALIVKNGVDLHSYQPSASDIVQISTADIFVYVGGPSDQWVSEVLSTAKNKDMKVINLMELLSDKLKDEGEALEEDPDEEEDEKDEHLWLSIDNARITVQALCDAIVEKDPENAQLYTRNTAAYMEELNGIDVEYKKAVANAENKTLIFCDRFPFRYLFDEYGLEYIAAFPGCSAETEASFETVAALTSYVKDLNAKAVFKIDGSDGKLAKTVQQNSKYFDIVSLDSMQSTTLREAFNDKTYAQVMRTNLENLKKGL